MKKIVSISILTSSLLFSAQINFDEANSEISRVSPLNNANENAVLSYHDSIAVAKKAVVNISSTRTTKTRGNYDEFFNDPFFKEFFGFNFGVPQERQKSSSLGSGVIISKDGYIITNNHVIEDSDMITVVLSGSQKEYKAKVIGTDSKTDLAVIKIEANNLTPIKLADSSKVLEGDVVFAIGNPFGVGSSITRGIISGLNKNNIGLNQYENFIQTDASINPGNSGGALVDSRGALVGINTAILSRGGDSSGIGFAIPSNMVKDIAKKLISDGKIERGYLGVMISDLTEEQKELYQNKVGALISSVEKGFPADMAGLKRGDLIVKINEHDIKGASDMKNFIGSLTPNQEIEVLFERGGKVNKIKVKLANVNIDAKSSKAETSIDGLGITNLSDEIRMRYKIAKELTGVFVTEVKDGSSAQEYGFEQGDVIIQVADDNISDVQSFVKAINAKKGKKLVWVSRRGVIQGLVIR
ncbi:Do family serine endopeptidase [Campylobacter mucosalis]|uniref:Do family serine endopeptidase n=1 Tax=Campylobacter mucosalis TaxID=202 RepID=UPI00147086AB|nr:Do family serine endopeptidase [Campylobacter mucosalis]